MEDGPRERDRITEVADGPVDPTEPVVESSGRTDSGAGAVPVPVPVPASESKVTLPAMGYELGASIGRGGMGEVIAAFDRRIGREVAIKRMRSARPSDDATARFLREARI